MWRRRHFSGATTLLVSAACGPTTVIPDATESGAGDETDTASSDTVNAQTSGAASSDGGVGPETSTSSTTGALDSGASLESAGEESTDGIPDEPFDENLVLGVWSCAGGDRAFALTIDHYDATPVLEGKVCSPADVAGAPQDWAPCASLSSHPMSVDETLWIYAMIPAGETEDAWTVSGMLIYDILTDSMEGLYLGPGAPKRDKIACTRVR